MFQCFNVFQCVSVSICFDVFQFIGHNTSVTLGRCYMVGWGGLWFTEWRSVMLMILQSCCGTSNIVSTQAFKMFYRNRLRSHKNFSGLVGFQLTDKVPSTETRVILAFLSLWIKSMNETIKNPVAHLCIHINYQTYIFKTETKLTDVWNWNKLIKCYNFRMNR